MTKAKYNVGDRVVYYDANDAHKAEKTGLVSEISETDVYEWNKTGETRVLYKLSSTEFLRNEEDIIGLCD